jgi:hypothetical protein
MADIKSTCDKCGKDYYHTNDGEYYPCIDCLEEEIAKDEVHHVKTVCLTCGHKYYHPHGDHVDYPCIQCLEKKSDPKTSKTAGLVDLDVPSTTKTMEQRMQNVEMRIANLQEDLQYIIGRMRNDRSQCGGGNPFSYQ